MITMSPRLFICLLTLNPALAIFSDSDVELINSQQNSEQEIKRLKVDYEQRLRDAAASCKADKDRQSSRFNQLQTSHQSCQGDVQAR